MTDNRDDDVSSSTPTRDAVRAALYGTPSPEAGVRRSVALIPGPNPTFEAEMQRLSRETGVPLTTVRALPEQTRSAVRAQDIVRSLTGRPRATAFMADPLQAAIAHDDVDTLTQIEDLITGEARADSRPLLGAITEPLQRGLALGRRNISLMFESAGLFRPLQDAQDRAAAAAGIEPSSRLGTGFRLAQPQREADRFPVPEDIAQGLRAFADADSVAEAFFAAMDNPRAVLETTFQSFGMSAPAFATAAAGSLLGPVGVFAGRGLGSVGVEYGAALSEALSEAGVDLADGPALSAALQDEALMARARERATRRGFTIGLFDAITGQLAGRLLSGAQGLVSTAVRSAGEAGVQAVGGASGEAAAQFMAGQEYAPGDILLEGLAELPTALTDVPLNVAAARRAGQRAEQDARALEALAATARASRLRERDAAAFERFIDDLARGRPVSDVYIPAQVLAQSPNARELAAASPTIAEQLPLALEAGGDVRIPLGEFAARVAGAGLADGLLADVRVHADGLSQREAAAARENFTPDLFAEAERVARAMTNRELARAEGAVVEREVFEQLQAVGRFSPSVNRTYAALPRAFFETISRRVGVRPSELWAMYKARVVGESFTAPGFMLEGINGGFVPAELILDGQATIALFKGANLSTFLHESGHWFLEAYADLARTAPGLQADMQVLLDWFGVASLDAWHALDLEGKRASHEKFAVAFESYLASGRAPSAELKSMFARFRDWLLSVYRNVRGMPVAVPGEVRAVLDRMLATDEHIAQMEEARGLAPLFGPAEVEALGLDARDYVILADNARDEATADLQARGIRDMAYTARLREETIAKLNREANARRKELAEQIRQELAEAPIYRAREFLRTGRVVNEAGELVLVSAHRLDIDALAALYDGAPNAPDWKRLGYGAHGLLRRGGLHPDMAADMLGYDSGDALVRELLAAPTLAEAVEAETEARMLEQYAEIATPEALARAADAAIHNEVRARFLATELAALQQATGGARALLAMAREVAGRVVDALPVGKIRPGQFAAAELRAGKVAATALRKGDRATAARAKRVQMIQHVATRLAYEAEAEMDAARDLFRSIVKGSAEKIAKTRNVDIVQAARAILAAHGMGGQGKSARAYLEAVKAYDPEMFATLEPIIAEVEQGTRPLDDLSVAEMRVLRDHVESMWYLARREKQVEVDGQMVDREEIADALVARLGELGVEPAIGPREHAASEGEKRFRYLLGARAALRRVEAWVDQVDGGQVTGAFRRFVFQPVSEAADAYRRDAGAYIRRYRDLLKAIEPRLKAGRLAAPELNYTFGFSKGDAGRAELLHALLHTGNASNRKKLLLGRGWATLRDDGSVDTQVWDAFLARMHAEGVIGKNEWDFVQGVWDLLEELKPLAQRTHREVFGRYFDEVTAEPVNTPFGQYRGGYVPALADTFEVEDAAVYRELDAATQANSFMFPGTNRGFTRARVEYNRPLALDLRLLPSHIDKVLLFAHLEGRVRDVMRTLRNRRVAGRLTRYDATAYTDMLLPWLNRAAKQTVETPSTGWGGRLADRFFRTMRSRSGLAAMTANFTNAFQQVTGFTLTAVKVQPKFLLRAAVRYLKAPEEVSAQVAGLSAFMANRMDAEASRMRAEIDELLLNPSTFERVQATTTRHGYFLQSAFQNVVDNITWAAAFDEATAQGQTEADAVRAANAAVRLTQGSLQPEDISRFEAGTAFTRLFTQFSGYFNMQANLLGSEFAQAMQAAGLRKGAGRMAYVFTLGFLLPAWTAEAIVKGMAGSFGDGDDDYLDDWLAFVLGAPARNAAGMVPILGPSTLAALNTFNDKPYDDRLSTAPAVSMLESAVRTPASVYKALADDGSAARAVRDTLTLVTLTTGVPVSAIGRPAAYLADVAQGRVEATSAPDALRGLLSGRASPDSRQ